MCAGLQLSDFFIWLSNNYTKINSVKYSKYDICYAKTYEDYSYVCMVDSSFKSFSIICTSNKNPDDTKSIMYGYESLRLMLKNSGDCNKFMLHNETILMESIQSQKD